MKQLTIGNKTFTNRFFLGTGKFASSEQPRAALAASETELVTVAFPRICRVDGGFVPPCEVDDADLEQMMLAFRIAFP